MEITDLTQVTDLAQHHQKNSSPSAVPSDPHSSSTNTSALLEEALTMTAMSPSQASASNSGLSSSTSAPSSSMTAARSYASVAVAPRLLHITHPAWKLPHPQRLLCTTTGPQPCGKINLFFDSSDALLPPIGSESQHYTQT